MTLKPAATSLSVENASELHEHVRRMMHETVLSLLSCFDPAQKRFYTSVHAKSAPGSATARDTAIVLTAIETSGKDVMDLTSDVVAPTLAEFLDNQARHRDVRGFKPIPYKTYQKLVFTPSLNDLARPASGVDSILGTVATASPPFEPFKNRDAFTCARILRLLNLFNTEQTHKSVYAAAADFVVDALTRTYAPLFAFGGVSLTGTEAHAFPSYYAILSIKDIHDILLKRSEQHRAFADLLRKMKEWREEADSQIKLRYKDPDDFLLFLDQELARLKNAVGLTPVIDAIRQVVHKQLTNGLDLEAIPTEIASTLQKSNWLDEFAKLVETEIRRAGNEARLKLQSLPNQKDVNRHFLPSMHNIDTPGLRYIADAKAYLRCMSISWKMAFLEGTRYVLRRIEALYEEDAVKSSFKELAAVFDSASTEWADSAALTRDYVVQFASWARLEINRQITRSVTPYRPEFDPTQLAFALRIYHDLLPGRDPHLIEQGLGILLEAQREDGTWRSGSPLIFEREFLQAVYPSNLEVINAALPVIRTYGGLNAHYHCLNRVFQWLQANRVRIDVSFNKEQRRITGWAADKVPERGRVDVWMTALALEFLDGFRQFLETYINENIWKDKYDVSQVETLISWEQITDPELSKSYTQRTTTEIEQNYIRPFREEGSSQHSSLLLYGPPGTAKSTLAGALARELDWNLVTVTPSDFVKEGIEKSEKMARELFEDFQKLRRVVILFDEIDEMLRSRKTEPSHQTGVAMLQFIVPGMLPKLQNLKQYGERGKLIFIIATNYRERLDSAVTRRGRIDHEVVVLPPDPPARAVILQQLLERHELFRPGDMRPALQNAARFMASHTHGWVYRELAELGQDVLRQVFAPHQNAKGAPGLRELCTDNEGLARELKLKLTDQSNPWKGTELLGIRRALDLGEIYRDRPEATNEGMAVLRVCWPESPDESTVKKTWNEQVLQGGEAANQDT